MTASPQAYLEQIKSALNQSPVVAEWALIDEMTLSDRGHIRVRLTLNNGDFVEASEFFVVRETRVEQQRYRYQWMDSTKTQLRKRWDNAPHFPDVETFPNHVHVEQEANVLPSTLLGILNLLTILAAANG